MPGCGARLDEGGYIKLFELYVTSVFTTSLYMPVIIINADLTDPPASLFFLAALRMAISSCDCISDWRTADLDSCVGPSIRLARGRRSSSL